MAQIRCSSCKNEKDFSEFYTDSSRSSGYTSKCKDCGRKYKKEWAEKRNMAAILDGEKTCSTCNVQKSVLEFHKHRTAKDGRVGICKPCAIERSATWYNKNRESTLARMRGDKSRNNHYKVRFKMTLEDYIEMSEDQNNICANIGCTEDAKSQRNGVLVVDHNRECCPGTKSCGKCIRGLLCQGCNKSLGLLSENKDRILGLISYIDLFFIESGDLN